MEGQAVQWALGSECDMAQAGMDQTAWAWAWARAWVGRKNKDDEMGVNHSLHLQVEWG